MDLGALYHIVDETTSQFRKGEMVTTKEVGGITVTDVYAMPHEDESGDLLRIDVHFMVIGVNTTVAKQYEPDFIKLLGDYPEPDRLAGGPSYIELGGVLGSQDTALRFMALGEALKLWTVITPARLGITGEEGDQLAGNGLVLISGWKP